MRVAKPEPGDPAIAARIRAASSAYTTSATEIAGRDAQAQERIKAYREGLEALAEAAKAGEDSP